VFFTNSGSEAVETALKMAIAYHRVRGEGTRTRLIGRERGYHGVNFGGISVGGMVGNRKTFGTLLPASTTSATRTTRRATPSAWASRARRRTGRRPGTPGGAARRLSTIAAVIVEPVAGLHRRADSAQGYLQSAARDLRQARHPADLRRGHHRLRPHRQPFGADTFGVTPDMITTAKGLTNGCVPMGAVIVKQEIHDAFMTGPEHLIEFPRLHLFGHPLACAAGLGTLDTYAGRRPADPRQRAAGLLRRCGALAEGRAQRDRHPQHRPGGRHRAGPIAGSRASAPSTSSWTATSKGVLIRTTGDIIALSPPLIIERSQIDQIVDTLRGAIRRA
jgi:beta-alanine--pyruvate transaminase